MWSGPRNISTAMMRAWENRPDTVVVDEPLYAAYLARTGLDHPGREEVLAAQPTSLDAAVATLSEPLPDGRTVHFAKHMAQHVDIGSEVSWTDAFRNVLLIRDPAEVVASYVRSREACEPEDIGLLQQERLLDALARERAAGHRRRRLPARPGGAPALAVRLARHRLHRPDAVLAAGPGRRDGVWAPYWYDAVLRSTGFEPWRAREVHLSRTTRGSRRRAGRPTTRSASCGSGSRASAGQSCVMHLVDT
jgi:hypothetical protein